MREHRGKQFVYPTQKQGRDAHPEGKGIASSRMRGRAVSHALGRDIHPERSVSILSDEENNASEIGQRHVCAS